MAEWLKTALIDIVELIGGGTPKTSKAEYWDGNINWLSVKDFNNENRYVYSTEKTITEKRRRKLKTELLLNCISGVRRLNFGILSRVYLEMIC